MQRMLSLRTPASGRRSLAQVAPMRRQHVVARAFIVSDHDVAPVSPSFQQRPLSPPWQGVTACWRLLLVGQPPGAADRVADTYLRCYSEGPQQCSFDLASGATVHTHVQVRRLGLVHATCHPLQMT